MTMILEIEEGKEAAAREKILEMLKKENIKYKEHDPEDYDWEESELQELSESQKKELEKRAHLPRENHISMEESIRQMEEVLNV